MMSGPNSLDLNPLDYAVWGNAWVLSQAVTEPKTVSEFKDALQLLWYTLYRKKPLTTIIVKHLAVYNAF